MRVALFPTATKAAAMILQCIVIGLAIAAGSGAEIAIGVGSHRTTASSTSTTTAARNGSCKECKVDDVKKLLTVYEFKRKVNETFSWSVSSFVHDGADYQYNAVRHNVRAFDEFEIHPRMMVDVSHTSTSTTLFGRRYECPVHIDPTGLQAQLNCEKEEGMARAAAKKGVVMGVSTFATTSIEDIYKAAPSGTHWFQLYILSNRTVMLDQIRRAERSNYTAFFVTVDSPYEGRKLCDERGSFFAMYDGRLPNAGNRTVVETLALFAANRTWDDFKWIRNQTQLPLIAKGIYTVEDAQRARASGADAILVSNHGGRQLDQVPATIEVLGSIVDAMPDGYPVFLDSGVRTGTHAFIASSLGAAGVFIGRASQWGLAICGQEGVERVLDIICSELLQTMRLAGTPTVNDITRDFVNISHPYYGFHRDQGDPDL